MKLRKLFFSKTGRIFLAALGFLLYYAVFIYPPTSLLNKLGIDVFEKLFDEKVGAFDIFIVILFTLPLTGRIMYQLFHSRWPRHFMAISMTWSGIAFFIFFPTLLLDISHLIFKFSETRLYEITFVFVLVATLLSIYGVVNANLLFVHRLEIQDSRIANENNVVQISDVHIGSRSSFFINRIIKKINRLNPDKVFITGDLVDLSGIEEKELTLLKDINAPVYFVCGNHDRYVSLEKLLPILKRQGLTILQNETVSLDAFDVTGIDDAENPAQVSKQLDKLTINTNRYNILLYHRPQGYEDASAKGIDLMLSGHTHHGQILPFNLLVKQVFHHTRGTIHFNNLRLHISTGTSTWGPILRIGSLNEITLIHLKP